MHYSIMNNTEFEVCDQMYSYFFIYFQGNLDLIQLMLNAHNLEEKPEEVDKEIGGTADKPMSRKGA